MTILDGLEEEEMDRARAAIFAHFGVPPVRSFGDPVFVALDTKTQAVIKSYVHGYQPDVTKFFRGTLRSTVTCLECRQKSTISEEFLDISVPIGVPTIKTKTGDGFRLMSMWGISKRARISKVRNVDCRAVPSRPLLLNGGPCVWPSAHCCGSRVVLLSCDNDWCFDFMLTRIHTCTHARSC